MSFSCSSCNYTSDTKKCIINHIGKKAKCGENPSLIITEADIKCEYCNKKYNTHPSMLRHLKTCKNKIKKDNLEIELEKKDEENKKLKDELEKNKLNKEKIEKLEEKTKLLKLNTQISNISNLFSNFIYIIQLREFVNTDTPIFKIGRTKCIYNRVGDYPTESKIICVIPTLEYINNVEKTCIKALTKSFIRRKDKGFEYFEGNIISIVDTVMECCGFMKILKNISTKIKTD